MNKSTRLSVFAACLLAAGGMLCAQDAQIYTWTDKNGVVHYVDTPPEDPNAVSMTAPEAYRPGTADAYPPAEDVSAPDSEQDGVSPGAEGMDDENGSYADQIREQMAARREARRKQQAEQNQNCARARAQVATLEPSRRVFFTNAQGDTERMDDEERVRLVEQAKAEIEKYCE